MAKFSRFILLVTLTFLVAAFSLVPASNSQDVALTVNGEVEQELKLSLAELAKLPHKSVKAKEHNGKEASFDGIPLNEILQRAGVKFGEHLRGKALATYLLVTAKDGYTAVFALPELDPAFTDRTVLLVDRKDNQALSTPEGPLRIVVPDEKRHGRWIRQVQTLTIKRASN